MRPPACIHPIFRDVIERHFPELKISPGNGSEGLGVPVLAESGLTPCSSRRETPATNDEARESNNAAETAVSDRSSLVAKVTDSRGARYLHYPILCMALLEENAILKQRLENLAKTDAAMFPK